MGRSDSSSRSRSRSRSKDRKSKKNKKYRRSSSKSPHKERKHKKEYRDKSRDRERDRDRRDFHKEHKRQYIEYQEEEEEEQEKKYRPNNEPAQWLFIWNVQESDQITQDLADTTFQDLSIKVGTSMPNEVRLVPYYQQIYIQYPSADIASKILYHTEGSIYLGEKKFDMDFYSQQQKSNHSSVIPAHLDTTVDWQCEKCNYQNFSKRTKCHKCQRPKSEVCKALVAPNHSLKQLQHNQSEANPQTSLMVRGQVMHTVTEGNVYDVFSKLASVKDIRIIKDRQTGNQRDFCFVEFHTVQEAERVLDLTSKGLRILGQDVSVLLSRNNKKEDQNAPIPGLGLSATQNTQLQYLSYLQAIQEQQEQPTIIQEVAGSTQNSDNQQYQQQLQQLQQKQKLAQQQQQQKQNQDKDQEAKKQDKVSKFKNEQQQLEIEKKKAEIQKQKLEQQRKKEEQLKIQQEIEKKLQQEKEKQQKQQNQQKKMEQDLKKWEKQQELLREQQKNSQNTENNLGSNKSLGNNQQENDDKPLIIICSICKRKFPTEEKLKVHDKLSELHKINLKKMESYRNMN